MCFDLCSSQEHISRGNDFTMDKVSKCTDGINFPNFISDIIHVRGTRYLKF